MEKIIIQENQRGLLFRNGRFVKMLEAGKYRQPSGTQIQVLHVDGELKSDLSPLERLLEDPAVASATVPVEVRTGELVLHFADGELRHVLRRGLHVFWKAGKNHTFKVIDIREPQVSEEICAEGLMEHIPPLYYTKLEVEEYQKALIYYDKKLEKVMEAGTYYFWKGPVNVEANRVDTRQKQLHITGQEILTKDKVSLRINFVCTYRITDHVKILTEVEKYEDQLHVAAQLALREYVGGYKLDEILESRDGISAYVTERLKQKAEEIYVEISDAGVRDIILPGEIRSIMNTVLIAEKRAQANVISRREEVASTRSLLNTARLMEENETLYKLKELEYLEKICSRVSSINVSGGGDLISRLTEILRGERAV